jgi:hypothetical protein
MLHRIPQPPVNPAQRAAEHHDFWPGFIALLIGGLLVFGGAQRLTGLDTVEGNSARETQLIKAFAFGGLQYAAELVPPAPPRPTGNPAADAAALARWDQEQANASQPAWKVRVDTGAKTPCPT